MLSRQSKTPDRVQSSSNSWLAYSEILDEVASAPFHSDVYKPPSIGCFVLVRLAVLFKADSLVETMLLVLTGSIYVVKNCFALGGYFHP
jgi:hypothetical protein